jgi:hypothetical protein
MWRPSERWRSGWDGEFESPLLQLPVGLVTIRQRRALSELAAWVRETAAKCRLPNPLKELLKLARRYEVRAGYLERRRARRRCSSTLLTKKRSRSSIC